jgi:hypothetical protein
MDKLQWIKDLVLSEQKMEEQGLIDYNINEQTVEHLMIETIDFLKDIKISFAEASSAFNELKTSSLGRIKLYGISNTEADFMLFRNGFKLIFTVKSPGVIKIYFSHINSQFTPNMSLTQKTPQQEILLESSWGPFGDLIWTYNGHQFKLDYLVKFFVSRFVKESSK